MHTIEAARLKPGVSLEAIRSLGRAGRRRRAGRARRHPRQGADLLGPESAREEERSSTRSTPIRSRRPPTASPRASRRSTSAGRPASFRYLMPDFRARVHRGETFLIAGDRFAIGSSREMSPAGLKGVAEEVGLEMVDRLRRQHGRHLPAQRAQPRAAGRAEPRGGGRRAGRRRVQLRSGDRAG